MKHSLRRELEVLAHDTHKPLKMAFFPLHALFMMDQSQQNAGPRTVPVSSLGRSSVLQTSLGPV